mgnify:FL=1
MRKATLAKLMGTILAIFVLLRAFMDISRSLANEMSVIDVEKRIPEKSLRTPRYSHHGKVQSQKFYKLCFHPREHYEQPSLDVQPDKKTKNKICPQMELTRKTCF